MNLREAIDKHRELWITAAVRHILEIDPDFRPEKYLNKEEKKDFNKALTIIDNTKETI